MVSFILFFRHLIAVANARQLPTIVQSIVHYAQDESDSYSQKLAFSVLNKVVLCWGGISADIINNAANKLCAHKLASKKISNPSNASTPTGSAEGVSTANFILEPKPALTGFESFLYESIVPVAFEVPRRPGFNLADGQSTVMLVEIASLQKALYFSQGNKYLEYLRSIYIPQRYPGAVDMLDELLASIAQADTKDVRKVLRVCFPFHLYSHSVESIPTSNPVIQPQKNPCIKSSRNAVSIKVLF